MPNQSMGWWSFVVCDSFKDEMYGDVKTSGDDVRGRIVSVSFNSSHFCQKSVFGSRNLKMAVLRDAIIKSNY